MAKYLGFFLLLITAGCGNQPSAPSNTASNRSAATPVPTASIPKDGDYPAKGVITKLNSELGSIEVDHENVEGLMPAMIMEFYVTDKALMSGLALGDKIEFTIQYKQHSEKISAIKKVK